MDQKPFLELFPFYKQQITINLILEFSALLILSLLIIQFIRRKHRTFELTLFFQMCFCNVLMAFVSMAIDIYPLFVKVGDHIPESAIFIIFILPPFIDRIFSITLLVQWLIYVEYTLHQSRDLIRRRYTAAFWVFAVAAILQLVSIPILYWQDAPFDQILVYNIISVSSSIILFSFIIATYVILILEKKRNRIPEYIRLTPTNLCMIGGFTANLLLSATLYTEYAILPLFFAVGLLFADYHMYKRLNDIDPDTGFYNRRYLSTLITYSKKKKLTGATLIRIKTSHISENTAELLKFWEPWLCKTIKTENDQFLLLSAPVKDIVSDRFISMVKDHFKKEGIPVETSCETDWNAPLDKLLKKYL